VIRGARRDSEQVGSALLAALRRFARRRLGGRFGPGQLEHRRGDASLAASARWNGVPRREIEPEECAET
jgi:hypothetical protein